MTPRMLLQLAWLFTIEAESIMPDPYRIPRKQPSTDVLLESARLHTVASEFFGLAEAQLPPDAPTGTDAAFGDDSLDLGA